MIIKDGNRQQPSINISNKQQVWRAERWYLESDDTLLPGAHTREIDFSEGLLGQLDIDALWSDRKLEGHRLVGLCHIYRAQWETEENTEQRWRGKGVERKRRGRKRNYTASIKQSANHLKARPALSMKH